MNCELSLKSTCLFVLFFLFLLIIFHLNFNYLHQNYFIIIKGVYLSIIVIIGVARGGAAAARGGRGRATATRGLSTAVVLGVLVMIAIRGRRLAITL